MELKNTVKRCQAKDAVSGALYILHGSNRVWQKIAFNDSDINIDKSKCYFNMLYRGSLYEIEPTRECYKLEDYEFTYTHIINGR